MRANEDAIDERGNEGILEEESPSTVDRYYHHSETSPQGSKCYTVFNVLAYVSSMMYYDGDLQLAKY